MNDQITDREADAARYDWRKTDNDENLTSYDQGEIGDIRELLVGRSVTKVSEDHLKLDDGTLLRVIPNEGCGGCTSGWYQLAHLEGTENVITSVEFDVTPVKVTEGDYSWEQQAYRIFVFAGHDKINLLSVEGDDGNGYYGTGYSLVVRRPEAKS